MKKIEAYKCDFCPKTSTNAGALFQHERKCRDNPYNKHKCFEFCKHLKMEFEDGYRIFTCEKKQTNMYSYKAEHRNLDIEHLTKMPIECDDFESMMRDELAEKYDALN